MWLLTGNTSHGETILLMRGISVHAKVSHLLELVSSGELSRLWLACISIGCALTIGGILNEVSCATTKCDHD